MAGLNSILAFAGLRNLFGHPDPFRDDRRPQAVDAHAAGGAGNGTGAAGKPLSKISRRDYPHAPIEIPSRCCRVIDGDTVSLRPGMYRAAGPREGRDWECRAPLRVRLRSVGAAEVNRYPDFFANPPRDIWGEDARAEKLTRDRAQGRHNMADIATEGLRLICEGRNLVVMPSGADRHGRLLADLYSSVDGLPGFSVERTLLELGLVTARHGEDIPPHRFGIPDLERLRRDIAERSGFTSEPSWLQAGRPERRAGELPDWLGPVDRGGAGREPVPGIDREFGADQPDGDESAPASASYDHPDWF